MLDAGVCGQKAGGAEGATEVWGFCSLCCLVVQALKYLCQLSACLAGQIEGVCCWHGGVMKGKDRLYKIAYLFSQLFLN